MFGKLGRAISVAAHGNPDPTTNLRLKAEIEHARAVNMPGENIERAISRVVEKGAAALIEVQLELIGPGGSAVVVNAITDNTNRTINELKQIASRHGAHMAGQGAVAWMFKKTGIIRLDHEATDAEQLRAIDAGAEDVQSEEGSTVIRTTPEHFDAVRSAVNGSAISAAIELLPTTTTPLPDESSHQQLEALLETLDTHEDVQSVFTNAEEQ
jgi:YebC/PmpR family DNA-binding regulatory protein